MSTNSRPWFEVDRAGLAKLVDGRSKALIIFELVQNAWDQDVSRVDVELHPVPGSAAATLSVIDDDPDGFRDLTHAYTLFAESGKKCDPEKRGRFNLGEKLVLAMCSEARIVTTSGGFAFLPSGERKAIRQRRKRGSEFCGTLRMTREEYRAALEAVRLLLAREGVSTYFNGVLLAPRAACNTFRTRLKTVVADERGVLREARRETEVRLYAPREGERAVLYEMGIPVVETGDRWHADVRQKIPLNMQRDNVPPSYLRELRTAVLDGMHREINGQDVASEWVNQALSTAASDAVSSVLDAKYGQRRCSYSVDDPEANKRAVAAGYSVIPPRAFSKEQWANIRQADCVEPAGKLFPTPRPYSPNGRPERVILETDWTPAMKRTAEYSRHLGELLFGAKITVRIINEPTVGWDANYGHCVLTLNLGRLGRDWFDSIGSEEMHALLLHEFAHHFEFDHLSDAYYGAICRLGAKLTALALRSPQLLGSDGTGAGVPG